jgi:hypothetical protein
MNDELNVLEGRTIKTVRPMTDVEMEREGWKHSHETPPVLVLDDGQCLFPSQDSEDNGPGALFGYYPETNSDFIVR